MNKYYQIHSEYLAKTLVYFGFSYYIFNDEGKTIFSFKNSNELQSVLKRIKELKINLNYEKNNQETTMRREYNESDGHYQLQ